ncbi:MAG: DUF1674 domain-containing protein [Lysobacterales bacterium 14-68-21]|jgi:hypothetical protein|nr:MAG: DUF1674 domain-containing protein [Xanthomonadales bacterium 15-68-25]OZB65340.1 MAG: DUF1674 domain-containing protein [Xanthomonadales bacterium 14-68-21]
MSDTRSHPESKQPAVPAADGVLPTENDRRASVEERPAPDPTRYGDWEKNGRCIDF